MILGSGPNRIGQGVEFDYCCVHAAFALRDAGYETVMVNCNPETVSTDYDTSDRLFFEPLTDEDVLNVCDGLQDASRPAAALKGVIVALGGQTPLKLAHALEAGGHPDPRHAARVDRRGRGPRAVQRAVRAARHPAARRRHRDHASTTRSRSRDAVGYPVLVRPSYVLGGRAMEIVYDDADLRRAMGELAHTGSLGREGGLSAERPALVDRFLEDAIEVDVDALRDRTGEVRDRRRSWSTSRKPACTPATPRARSRRRRCRRAVLQTIERAHARARRRARRRRSAQRAVRGEGRRRCS